MSEDSKGFVLTDRDFPSRSTCDNCGSENLSTGMLLFHRGGGFAHNPPTCQDCGTKKSKRSLFIERFTADD